MTSKRWIQVGVMSVAVAFILWATAFIYRSSFVAIDGRRYFSLFDDAMISMRYAWNFSHGLGLVWNPGEPVEGYTNLLMIGLMSVWTGLFDKSSAVLAVQLTGIPILLGIAVLGLLHWLELARGNDVSQHMGFGALVFLGSLLYYPLAYWTLMGMETGLLTLLLLTGSFLLLVYMRTGINRALLSSAVVLGLGYLARPDSAPLAVLLVGTAALLSEGSTKRRVSAAALGLSVYLLFPILQSGFRAIYYGSLVPLTYTLKMTGMSFELRLANGLGFIRPFLQQARWAYLLGAAGAVLGLRRRKAFLIIPPLTLVVYQVLIGGDAWSYWRLVSPGIPYLLLLTVAGVSWMVGALERFAYQHGARHMANLGEDSVQARRGFSRLPSLSVIIASAAAVLLLGGLLADILRPGSPGFGYIQRYLMAGGLLLAFATTLTRKQPVRQVIAFGVTMLILVSLNSSFLQEAVLFRLPYTAENNRNHVDVSLSIRRFTKEDASVGVFWAGIIPYYTSRYAIDFLGRNDPYIASLPADVAGPVGPSGMFSVPGHNKYDLKYSVLERRPSYVEGFSWGSQNLTPILEDLYVEISLPGPDPAFLRGDPAIRWDMIPAEKLISP